MKTLMNWIFTLILVSFVAFIVVMSALISGALRIDDEQEFDA